MLTDKVILTYVAPFLFIVFFLYMVPVILTLWLFASTSYFTVEESRRLESLLQSYTSFDGVPNSVATMTVQSLPALVGSICYRRLSHPKIYRIARFLFLLLLIGGSLTLLALFFLNPDDSSQWSNVLVGRDGLIRLHHDCEGALRTLMIYILLFVGLQIPVQSREPTP